MQGFILGNVPRSHHGFYRGGHQDAAAGVAGCRGIRTAHRLLKHRGLDAGAIVGTRSGDRCARRVGRQPLGLARQAIAESMVLSIAGALGGLALAYGGIRGITSLAPSTVSIPLNLQLISACALLYGGGYSSGALVRSCPGMADVASGSLRIVEGGGRSGTAGTRKGSGCALG